MRTLLTETKQIDEHLHKQLQPPDALLFEAKLIIDPELKYKVMWHKQTLNLVQQYGRKTLNAEIEAVHQKLFTLPEHLSFVQKIRELFSKR